MISSTPLASDGKMRLRVKTPPAKEPVSLAEFKAFARIDGSAEDAFLSSLLKGVRDAVEQVLGRALIEQTIVAQMDFWPEEDELVLPRPPLISISEVRTLDETGSTTSYAASYYYTVADEFRPRLVIKDGVTAPINYDRYSGGYEVEYTAGYGSTASYVPDLLRLGIMQWAAVGYENRIVSDVPPPEAWRLLERYRVPRV